jgi:shikimate kinase
MKNIVLIGFMATGKTVIGRNLAGLLKREFVDTDAAIEKLTGKTVSQIFAAEGEARFRLEEELLVQKLSSRDNLVIATGGGLVLKPATSPTTPPPRATTGQSLSNCASRARS